MKISGVRLGAKAWNVGGQFSNAIFISIKNTFSHQLICQ